MSAITLRPCTANDVDIAVPLIHDSGPIAFRYVFSQDHEAQSLEFLRSAFVKGSGQFGCANHLAVERDGAMVAVAASWDARANLRHTLIAARQILGFYGLAGVGVIGRGIRMERVVKPAVAGVAYLGHLTVAPECRGQGIGREMLGQLLQRARAAGHVRAALDVAVSNPRARALYQGLGFRVLDTRRSRLVGRWGSVVDHEYMECDLARSSLDARGASP
ncbi:MAG: GNAT family N-acetyltransferase [Gammaproteobacteria bacterium]|jgi:ribosomal protein S18 acetylase RimI-like enzyme|nr:GNAT family N-acetyltransferase [Gammaproteobacteria bacterium]MBP6051918.1 GNAT family N-acetyltransferase [Pseudomonadales bacterium]MBK6581862.1 GNAT family N-acetyltransferase [Gammaproteobacteria bacterium]MBK7169431.1 GNAT family N-acetyltransferase [Gammaproteobacteria bacterium]MBK7520697.1 GNAT family N-acetyltransferase [Gammaproteobacteria bacterium]